MVIGLDLGLDLRSPALALALIDDRLGPAHDVLEPIPGVISAICYRPSVCLSVCRMSSVTSVRPTHAVQIFGNIFYGIRYLGHPLTSAENFTDIVPGKPLRRGS